MTLVDLSKFKQSYVKDTDSDMQEIAALKQVSRISEGSHEVVVNRLHKKEDGSSIYLSDTLGGSIGFSLIVNNAQKAEQSIFISIPLAVTFKQACLDVDKKNQFIFRNAVRSLQSIGIDPITLRETIIETNGTSAELLVGAQFIVNNSWPMKKLHLEYDSGAKAHFFVTSMGEKFSEGELSVPIALDSSKYGKDRYAEAVAIAYENSYELATQMNTSIESNPTVDNANINEKLKNVLQPKKKPTETPKLFTNNIVNKTKPPFPGVPIKKVGASLDIPEDIDL